MKFFCVIDSMDKENINIRKNINSERVSNRIFLFVGE